MAPRRWIDSHVEHSDWAVWFVGGRRILPTIDSFTGRMEGKKEDIERVEGKKEKETIEGDDNVVLQIIIVESWLPFRVLMESLYFCELFIFFSVVSCGRDHPYNLCHPCHLPMTSDGTITFLV